MRVWQAFCYFIFKGSHASQCIKVLLVSGVCLTRNHQQSCCNASFTNADSTAAGCLLLLISLQLSAVLNAEHLIYIVSFDLEYFCFGYTLRAQKRSSFPKWSELTVLWGYMCCTISWPEAVTSRSLCWLPGNYSHQRSTKPPSHPQPHRYNHKLSSLHFGFCTDYTDKMCWLVSFLSASSWIVTFWQSHVFPCLR